MLVSNADPCLVSRGRIAVRQAREHERQSTCQQELHHPVSTCVSPPMLTRATPDEAATPSAWEVKQTESMSTGAASPTMSTVPHRPEEDLRHDLWPFLDFRLLLPRRP